MSRPTAFAFSFSDSRRQSLRLAEHAGKPILIVNTASQCGYTPQYAGLQQLWTRYRDKRPAHHRRAVERFRRPGAGRPAEINKTAHGQYGVGFPLAAKAEVRGPSAHPFYKWAALERPGDGPRWNFHKYLVGRDGRIDRGVFDPDRADRSARHRGHRERIAVAERSRRGYPAATIGPIAGPN